MPPGDATAVYDLAIVGGGVNGCGIARAAAGRGWSVYLCEAGDLGCATSCGAPSLLGGGASGRKSRAFRPLRDALAERDVLWGIAPHIVWPVRFVLPHHQGLRPAWLLRLGLALQDSLGGHRRLPPASTMRLRNDPAGIPLKPAYTLGLGTSDCCIDESRLVVLNAMDAAAHGAAIAPRTRCTGASRGPGGWTLQLRHSQTGALQSVRARAIVNAAGPWAVDVLNSAVRTGSHAQPRMVKESQIVVRQLYPGPQSYLFQNADGRSVCVTPHGRDFTLIGVTQFSYEGNPAEASASSEEIAYLCRGASEYLKAPVTPPQVVWTYSRVRPVYGTGPSTARRHGCTLALDAANTEAPLLSVFGGTVPTYRRLAEAALARLTPHLPPAPGLPPGWTATAPLPGGDFPPEGFGAALANLQSRYPFVAQATLPRLLRAYGTRAEAVLGGAKAMDALGRVFGADLTEAEVRYLVRAEWAVTTADVLWRRSKLGLRFTTQETARLDAFMTELHPEQACVA